MRNFKVDENHIGSVVIEIQRQKDILFLLYKYFILTKFDKQYL